MKKFNYSRFLMIFLVVLIPISILSVALNTMSYRNMLIKTYVDSNIKVTTDTIQKINYSMQFGKSLERFYGLETLLEETKEQSDDILDIGVVNGENQLIASTKTMTSDIPNEVRSKDYVSNNYGIFVKVTIDDNHMIVILLDSSYVNSSTLQYMKTISIAGLIIILVLILLSFIVYFTLKRIKNGELSPTNLKGLLISLLVLFQVIFGVYVLSNYTDEYVKSIDKMIDVISKVIDNDIESVVKQGIPFDDLKGVDEYLKGLSNGVEEFVNITINNSSSNNSDSQIISKKIQILDKDYYVNIEYRLNQQIVRNNIISLLISILILVAVTILISIEVGFFIFNSIDKNESNIKSNSVNLRGIRLFFFMVFLILRLDSGFISVLSQNLYDNSSFKGTSEFLIGLPTTLTSIATAIGLIVCLILVNKVGIKSIITLGAILFSVGSIASAFSSDLIIFSLSRVLSGLGMAAIISSTKLCAVFEKDSSSRLNILATVAAGQIAGTSCGLVLGGLFSAGISYKFVFLLESALILMILLFIKITGLGNEKENNKISPLNLINFIKIPKIFMYMLLIIIPIYMANIFTVYAVPLFGQEMKLSESIVSALIMLNFVLSAYTSKWGTKTAMKLFGEQKSVMVYIFIIIFSIGIFSIFNNLISLVITVTLLGIADGFGLNIIFDNACRIKPNIDKIVVMFSFLLISKIGESISPSLISSNLKNGVASASSILSYVLAITTVLYVLFMTLYKKRNKKAA